LNWCKENNLELNVTKTKELVIDFRKSKKWKSKCHHQWTECWTSG
jgi:hypothetical protein